jgi:hypothetical protein
VAQLCLWPSSATQPVAFGGAIQRILDVGLVSYARSGGKVDSMAGASSAAAHESSTGSE